LAFSGKPTCSTFNPRSQIVIMLNTYRGSCHCGAIQFEAQAPETVTVQDCNCSICSKTGFLHLILPKTQFKLLQGEGVITTYRFNTGVAQHTFCRICGCKPFYIPRSNPDGIDVNLRCLDTAPPEVTIEVFDGQNWEANSASLAHLSQEPEASLSVTSEQPEPQE
jgi:hypothetical protein